MMLWHQSNVIKVKNRTNSGKTKGNCLFENGTKSRYGLSQRILPVEINNRKHPANFQKEKIKVTLTKKLFYREGVKSFQCHRSIIPRFSFRSHTINKNKYK